MYHSLTASIVMQHFKRENTMTNQVNAQDFAVTVTAALQKKIESHHAETGIYSEDVKKSLKKITLDVSQLLIDCEKQDFAQWVETAPCKSIMRAVNFIKGLTDTTDKTLGQDMIAQALIQTAVLLKTDTLPLEILKHQTIKGKETEELSTMTKGRSIRKGERKMSLKTALSMISNRCGKNGYMQYLGMVKRADDKSVVINTESAFYKRALANLIPSNQ